MIPVKYCVAAEIKDPRLFWSWTVCESSLRIASVEFVEMNNSDYEDLSDYKCITAKCIEKPGISKAEEILCYYSSNYEPWEIWYIKSLLCAKDSSI